MGEMNYIAIRNFQSIPLNQIPELEYEAFKKLNLDLVQDISCHCVNYFGILQDRLVRLFCCIANDEMQVILISSCLVPLEMKLESLSAVHLCFERFERELHERFGIQYVDHPWLKPVRFAFNRFNGNTGLREYPFFHMESNELHEVGVGPIHAGVIEPGHFRFICNGEQILHLEIQLGYQHRGVESLFYPFA